MYTNCQYCDKELDVFEKHIGVCDDCASIYEPDEVVPVDVFIRKREERDDGDDRS